MRKRIFDVNVQGGFGRSPALVITGGQSGWGDGQNFSSGDVWLRERRGATISRPGPPRRPAREVLSSHETNGYKTLFLLGESLHMQNRTQVCSRPKSASVGLPRRCNGAETATGSARSVERGVCKETRKPGNQSSTPPWLQQRKQTQRPRCPFGRSHVIVHVDPHIA